jgi:hypothetical protein
VAAQVAVADAQILSHTTWAFSTLGIPARPLFTAIAEECLCTAERLEHFTAQEICVLAWSFGRQRFHHERLFARIAEIAGKQCRSYTPHNLQMLSLALGELNIRDDTLLEHIANESINKMATFSGTSTSAMTPFDCSNPLVAC